MGARDAAAPFSSIATGGPPDRRVPPGQGSARRGAEARRSRARRRRAGAAPRTDRLGSTEREIRQAQAEALGRTGERLQRLLDQIAALDRPAGRPRRAGRGRRIRTRRRRDGGPQSRPGRGGARSPSPDHPARGAGARAAHPGGAVLPCARAPAPARSRPPAEGGSHERRAHAARSPARPHRARRAHRGAGRDERDLSRQSRPPHDHAGRLRARRRLRLRAVDHEGARASRRSWSSPRSSRTRPGTPR